MVRTDNCHPVLDHRCYSCADRTLNPEIAMKELESFVKTLGGKPIAVFGLARSGLSTIKALKAAGGKTIAWDNQEAPRNEAKKLGADLQPLTPDLLKTCAFLVLAPGVPLHFPKPHEVVE